MPACNVYDKIRCDEIQWGRISDPVTQSRSVQIEQHLGKMRLFVTHVSSMSQVKYMQSSVALYKR